MIFIPCSDSLWGMSVDNVSEMKAAGILTVWEAGSDGGNEDKPGLQEHHCYIFHVCAEQR